MPSSASANGRAIKESRDRLGWTQEDLAAKAGLSVRVVAKAEAGGSISRSTREAIATAFSQANLTVSAQDLARDPAELAVQFLRNYVKYEAECVQHSLDIISSEIYAYIDGDPATNPIAGEYRGIEEFDGFFRKFFSCFVRSGGDMENPETRVIGNEVIAWGFENIHLPNITPTTPGFVMLKMRFEAGRMVRFEDYYESSGMMWALRHFAKKYPDTEWAKTLRSKAASSRKLPLP